MRSSYSTQTSNFSYNQGKNKLDFSNATPPIERKGTNFLQRGLGKSKRQKKESEDNTLYHQLGQQADDGQSAMPSENQSSEIIIFNQRAFNTLVQRPLTFLMPSNTTILSHLSHSLLFMSSHVFPYDGMFSMAATEN